MEDSHGLMEKTWFIKVLVKKFIKGEISHQETNESLKQQNLLVYYYPLDAAIEGLHLRLLIINNACYL